MWKYRKSSLNNNILREIVSYKVTECFYQAQFQYAIEIEIKELSWPYSHFLFRPTHPAWHIPAPACFSLSSSSFFARLITFLRLRLDLGCWFFACKLISTQLDEKRDRQIFHYLFFYVKILEYLMIQYI